MLSPQRRFGGGQQPPTAPTRAFSSFAPVQVTAAAAQPLPLLPAATAAIAPAPQRTASPSKLQQKPLAPAPVAPAAVTAPAAPEFSPGGGKQQQQPHGSAGAEPVVVVDSAAFCSPDSTMLDTQVALARLGGAGGHVLSAGGGGAPAAEGSGNLPRIGTEGVMASKQNHAEQLLQAPREVAPAVPQQQQMAAAGAPFADCAALPPSSTVAPVVAAAAPSVAGAAATQQQPPQRAPSSAEDALAAPNAELMDHESSFFTSKRRLDDLLAETQKLQERAREEMLRAQIVVNDTLIELTPWNRESLAKLHSKRAQDDALLADEDPPPLLQCRVTDCLLSSVQLAVHLPKTASSRTGRSGHHHNLTHSLPYR